jgi:hypothetical protein
VNIPSRTRKDKKNLENQLHSLLFNDINPTLETMMPKADDWDSWIAFEGIYEDAMDKIRHILIQMKGREPRKLYVARVIKPKLQMARSRTNDTLIQRQSAQIQLRKVKHFLERIALEGEEDSRREPQIYRQYIEWTQKLAPTLDRIP